MVATMTSTKPRGSGERQKTALRPLRDEVSEMLGSFRDMLDAFREEHTRTATDLARRLRNSTADRQRDVRDMLTGFHKELFARFQREGEVRRFRYGRGPQPFKAEPPPRREAPEPPPRREAPKPAGRAEPPSTAGKPAGGGSQQGAPQGPSSPGAKAP